jgi:aminomethyltransferase
VPIGTALHARSLPLCQSLNIREWSGYYSVSSYETHHEHEYNAIRSAAALIDVSPLFKYLVTGPDAVALVDRIITRDAHAMAVGQVYYTPWCDTRGRVIDDGTVTRIDEHTFRWTAADPSLRWFIDNAAGLDVRVDDISDDLAALALQGPTSAAILHEVADVDLVGLRYFRMARSHIAGVTVEISRTGYTGDLGYEIWIPRARAIEVWDALMAAGSRYGIRPVGMVALDVARTEAGLLLIDVDFHGSRKALIDSHSYTPFELGLGRLVSVDKRPFVGRSALVAERRQGHRRQIAGLEIGWTAVERLYERLGLAPQLPLAASRVAVPVYKSGRQIGKATTTTWSPSLKKLIALATLEAPHFTPGTLVDFELTVDAVRHRVPAIVVATPFFNPPRKTAAPVLTARP